jgi:hypothetical protein
MTGKIYEMAANYILQMVIKYTNIFHSKGPPKYTQIGIFGTKVNHVATLLLAASKLLQPAVDVIIFNAKLVQ